MRCCVAKLLSLFNYNQKNSEELLPYVVFQSHQLEGLESLSPDMMKITDSVYVADLHIVKSYWQKMASSKSTDPTDLVSGVIKKFLPQCRLAVFCEHPFQGLVFFNHLKIQDGQGFFKSTSLFSKKVYQNMGWHPWFLSARQVHDCFEKNSCLKKERQNFQSQLQRFARFTERVDLQEFSSLEQAHFFEIQRRFKSFTGLLWKWTFPQGESDETPTLFNFEHYQKLDGFPWIPFINLEKTEVENWLEYPLSEWGPIAEVLFHDLEKLSQKRDLKAPFKILELRWTLTLFDMTPVEQRICFKYPLCLEQEREDDFAILVKQLSLAFDQFQAQLSEQARDMEVVNCPLVVGWTLSVEKKVVITAKSQYLDPEEQSFFLRKEELQQLSDKVKTSLQSYQIEESFIPGLDFSLKEMGESVPGPKDLELLDLPRPFYIFPKEKELEVTMIKNSQFLDRTASDWWNRQDSKDSYRDCFLCELHDRQFIFAYRDYRGRWFHYGS